MKRRTLFLIVAIVLILALLGGCAWYLWQRDNRPEPITTTAQTTSAAPVTETTKAPRPYKSPIDFKSLQKKNEDIYAWLDIPNTGIGDLVVQSPTDDNQYLRHTIEGKYSIAGTLFTEHVYNTKSFDDRVTIIYGHHMLDETMFGPLQARFSEKDAFEKYNDIIIYLPEKELHYTPIAAVPYSNRHILYHFNCFPDLATLNEFMDEIYEIRGFSVNRKENIKLGEADRLLVLSTCLQGNRNKRYLVIAQLDRVVDQYQK